MRLHDYLCVYCGDIREDWGRGEVPERCLECGIGVYEITYCASFLKRDKKKKEDGHLGHLALHDYKCEACGHIHLYHTEPPAECEQCKGTALSITYEKWTKMVFANDGRPINERVHPETGVMSFFGAADDPLTRIEIGLQDKAGDSNYRTTTPEQRRYLLEKLAKDGDSKKLREEVLMIRKANQAEARQTVKRATSGSQ